MMHWRNTGSKEKMRSTLRVCTVLGPLFSFDPLFLQCFIIFAPTHMYKYDMRIVIEDDNDGNNNTTKDF